MLPEFWRSNSGLYACKISTLPSEVSPQPFLLHHSFCFCPFNFHIFHGIFFIILSWISVIIICTYVHVLIYSSANYTISDLFLLVDRLITINIFFFSYNDYWLVGRLHIFYLIYCCFHITINILELYFVIASIHLKVNILGLALSFVGWDQNWWSLWPCYQGCVFANTLPDCLCSFSDFLVGIHNQSGHVSFREQSLESCVCFFYLYPHWIFIVSLHNADSNTQRNPLFILGLSVEFSAFCDMLVLSHPVL